MKEFESVDVIVRDTKTGEELFKVQSINKEALNLNIEDYPLKGDSENEVK